MQATRSDCAWPAWSVGMPAPGLRGWRPPHQRTAERLRRRVMASPLRTVLLACHDVDLAPPASYSRTAHPPCRRTRGGPAAPAHGWRGGCRPSCSRCGVRVTSAGGVSERVVRVGMLHGTTSAREAAERAAERRRRREAALDTLREAQELRARLRRAARRWALPLAAAQPHHRASGSIGRSGVSRRRPPAGTPPGALAEAHVDRPQSCRRAASHRPRGLRLGRGCGPGSSRP
jgi:hypothetical protein